MALTGLQIFKLLPKTNCKKCGKPTCLAFAMGLAQKKAKLEDCPDVSDEAKSALDEASAPPIRQIKFGLGDNQVQIGQETVMFRHEEKFHNQTVIAVSISDNLTADALKERIEKIKALQFERVGTHIQVNSIAIINNSGSAETFTLVAETVKNAISLAMILISDVPEALSAAVAKVADVTPLLGFAKAETALEVAKIAKEHKCPVIAYAESLDLLAELTKKITAAGVQDIVMALESKNLKDQLCSLSRARTVALKKSFRQLGYPTISLILDGTEVEQTSKAVALVCKYSSIVVVETVAPYAILPILTTVMNIFTDPQKPVQVEPKIYAIGEVTENSPLLFTTNFSLTYYTVESDVEASRVPCYILVVDTEGTSVLTAYSGDKLNENIVAKALEDNKVSQIIKHKKMIIPGYVAVMSGKLEEKTGFEILVGPRESSMLPKYLKEVV